MVASDDWLINQASISVTVGATGSGSATGHFILFGRPGFQYRWYHVAGPDQDSWENPTDPIYVYLQGQGRVYASEIIRSGPFRGRV